MTARDGGRGEREQTRTKRVKSRRFRIIARQGIGVRVSAGGFALVKKKNLPQTTRSRDEYASNPRRRYVGGTAFRLRMTTRRNSSRAAAPLRAFAFVERTFGERLRRPPVRLPPACLPAGQPAVQAAFYTTRCAKILPLNLRARAHTLVRAIARRKIPAAECSSFDDPAALFAPRVAQSFSHLFALKSEIRLKSGSIRTRAAFVGLKRRRACVHGHVHGRFDAEIRQIKSGY